MKASSMLRAAADRPASDIAPAWSNMERRAVPTPELEMLPSAMAVEIALESPVRVLGERLTSIQRTM